MNAIDDYDSGRGWERVADAMDRHGATAVLANPELAAYRTNTHLDRDPDIADETAWLRRTAGVDT